jgi:hypothetical protein
MRFVQGEVYFSLLATNVKGLVKRIIRYGLNCFEQLFWFGRIWTLNGFEGYGLRCSKQLLKRTVVKVYFSTSLFLAFRQDESKIS